MEGRIQKAIDLFKSGYNCSQAVVMAYADIYELDKNVASKIAASFGGGIGRMRSVCGAASGMFILAGLEKGAIEGSDVQGKKDNYDLVQELAEKFKFEHGSLICAELLALPKESTHTETTPEARTEKYYTRRPCVKMVEDSARIYGEYLQKIGRL